MSSVSYKFQNIEKHLLAFYRLILENQNILKYMYYLNDDPLSSPDITDNIIENILQKNIILTPVSPSILKDEKVLIFLSPESGYLDDRAISNLHYRFDVVVPHSKWILDGSAKFRPFRIIDEFAKMVDGQPITGIGNCSIDSFKIYRVIEEYSCLSIPINVTGSSMKGN